MLTNVNRLMNTRNSAVPITISGVTSGNSIKKFAEPDPRPRQRARPSASATPIGVAISMSANASFRVCATAPRRSGSVNTPWTVSPVLPSSPPVHHSNDGPLITVVDRFELKEISTAITTGTIDQTTNAHVSTARKRGLPQGFANHVRILPGGAAGATALMPRTPWTPSPCCRGNSP